MFTPVSSQAQAFVPAHAAYPHLRNAQSQGRPTHGVMLYGAHGQPLPPQQQPPGPELPPPHGMYQPYGGPPPPPLASPMPPDQVSWRSSSLSLFNFQQGSNGGFSFGIFSDPVVAVLLRDLNTRTRPIWLLSLRPPRHLAIKPIRLQAPTIHHQIRMNGAPLHSLHIPTMVGTLLRRIPLLTHRCTLHRAL